MPGQHPRARIGAVVGFALAASVALAPGALAASNRDAPALCEQADEAGFLDQLGITRGECVTVSRNGIDRNPIANNAYAGLCAVDFVAEGRTKGECLHDLDPSSHVPFQASLVTSLDTATWTVTGVGKVQRAGAVAETGSILFIDASNAPVSYENVVMSTLTNDRGESLVVDYDVTLVDVASPPAGEDYAVTGGFAIIDGTGRFEDTGASGSIEGTCTSSFDSPIALCAWTLTGTTRF